MRLLLLGQLLLRVLLLGELLLRELLLLAAWLLPAGALGAAALRFIADAAVGLHTLVRDAESELTLPGSSLAARGAGGVAFSFATRRIGVQRLLLKRFP